MFRFRVRELISCLDYNELVAENIIPSDVFSNFDVPKKSFPKWAYKSLGAFGLFIERLVISALSMNEKDWENNIMLIYSSLFHMPCPFSLSNRLDRSYLFAFFHFAKNNLATYSDNLLPNQELSKGIVTGHPDLLSEATIFDIKMTSSWKSMKEHTILQLLAYAALVDSPFSHIAAILPNTRQIITYDITEWNPSSFRNLLFKKANNAMNIMPQVIMYPFLGSHANREKPFVKGLKTYYDSRGSTFPDRFSVPCQMFLSSRKKNFVKFTKEELKDAHEYITTNKIHYYTHTPYYVNLAQPFNALSEEKKETESWHLKILCHELKMTAALGGLGVVVHMGALEDTKRGIRHMYESVRQVLDSATEDCPLLLETAAGEGNDLCWRLEHFSRFYGLFNESQRRKLKVCVDTCHVFAGGYSPSTFITRFIEKWGPSSIKLVHFNDSRSPKGSRVDRHAHPGRGYIGAVEMRNALYLCMLNKIDVVMES